MMVKETKICSRCHESNADDEVMRTYALNEHIDNAHYQRLCKTCILHLENLLIQIEKYPFPVNGKPLVEKVHYYIESDFFVFTELYHLSRGYCCKNGCRHCAFGFKK
jgi:hypothetical protein